MLKLVKRIISQILGHTGWLRAILFFTALHCIGVYQGIYSFYSPDQTPYKQAGSSLQWQFFCNEIKAFVEAEIKKADAYEANGGVYSPYHYFRDLAEIYILELRLGFRGGSMSSAYLEPLHDKCKNSYAKGYNDGDMEKARQQFEANIEQYKTENGKQEDKWGWRLIFFKILFCYPKLLPLAVCLYLIWRREYRLYPNSTDLPLFRNPLSFILAIVFYPLFIGIIWYRQIHNTARSVLVEAEIRRFKKQLFCLLSDDELGVIQRLLTKGVTHRDIGISLLAAGLRSRHGLIIAIFATLVMSVVAGLVPRTSEAKETRDDFSRIIAQIVLEEQKLASDLSICQDEAKQKQPGPKKIPDLILQLEFVPILLVRLFRPIVMLLRLPFTFKTIDHIPVFWLFNKIGYYQTS